jgi:tRNA A37 threonylcarbamoyltransferase TsaD
MQQFESRKKNFSTATSNRRPVKLHLIMPELKNQQLQITGYDSRYSDILLSHDDMKNCFDPVVESIIDLINDQVNAVKMKGKPAVETIILVGGLGASPYIREKVQEWCTEKGIRLTTPWGGG